MPAERSSDRLRVLLTTEGTYPHTMGGVSTWCQILIEEMPEIDFTIFAHMMNPFLPEAYERPANTELVQVPIWGVEEPAEFNPKMSPRRVLMLSAMLTEERVRAEFCPLLREMLTMILDTRTYDPGRFGQLLVDMHLYFRENDYRGTFRTRAVWETFRELVLVSYGLDPRAEAWEDVEPETQPSPQEIMQRLGELRRGGRGVDEELKRSHRVPRLFEATEAMRVVYRLLTPLNYEMPEADVVHATAASFCGIPGIISRIQSGTPFLVTEHGVYMREQMLFLGRIGFPYHLRRFFIQFVSAVSRAVYHHADQISPVCHYNARWERRNGATDEQIEVIYNGVDPQRFRPREVPRSEAPTVVMVSRVDALKDLETALKVAAVVRDQRPGVRFLHFGPAPDAEYQARCRSLWKELGLQGTFEWKGSTRDAPGAYNQGDVVLLTSISEAFPYTVIEAMMCGRPVVSTNVGGVPEAVADLGVTARIRDVQALADGVVELLDMPAHERDRLGEECRRRSLELFTIEQSIESYRRSYRELPDRARLPSPLAPALPHGVPAALPPLVLPEYQPSMLPGPPSAPPVPARALDLPLPLPPVRREPAVPAAADLVAALAARDDDASDTSEAAVLRRLTSPSSAVRRRAVAQAAEVLDTLSAVTTFNRLLRDDPDASVRAAAADELAALVGTSAAAG